MTRETAPLADEDRTLPSDDDALQLDRWQDRLEQARMKREQVLAERQDGEAGATPDAPRRPAPWEQSDAAAEANGRRGADGNPGPAADGPGTAAHEAKVARLRIVQTAPKNGLQNGLLKGPRTGPVTGEGPAAPLGRQKSPEIGGRVAIGGPETAAKAAAEAGHAASPSKETTPRPAAAGSVQEPTAITVARTPMPSVDKIFPAPSSPEPAVARSTVKTGSLSGPLAPARGEAPQAKPAAMAPTLLPPRTVPELGAPTQIIHPALNRAAPNVPAPTAPGLTDPAVTAPRRLSAGLIAGGFAFGLSIGVGIMAAVPFLVPAGVPTTPDQTAADSAGAAERSASGTVTVAAAPDPATRSETAEPGADALADAGQALPFAADSVATMAPMAPVALAPAEIAAAGINLPAGSEAARPERPAPVGLSDTTAADPVLAAPARGPGVVTQYLEGLPFAAARVETTSGPAFPEFAAPARTPPASLAEAGPAETAIATIEAPTELPEISELAPVMAFLLVPDAGVGRIAESPSSPDTGARSDATVAPVSLPRAPVEADAPVGLVSRPATPQPTPQPSPEPAPAPEDLALLKPAPKPEVEGSPPVSMYDGITVFVHAPPSMKDADLDAVSSDLRETGFALANPSRVLFNVSSSHVRFYRALDADAAEVIAEQIGGEARDFTDFVPSPPPGHIEVWLEGQTSARIAKKPPAKAGNAKSANNPKPAAPRSPRTANSGAAERSAAEAARVRALRDQLVLQLRRGAMLGR